jgi:hypothetical protein
MSLETGSEAIDSNYHVEWIRAFDSRLDGPSLSSRGGCDLVFPLIVVDRRLLHGLISGREW